MKRTAMVVMVVLAASVAAQSQYVIPYPYLGSPLDPYQNRSFGTTYFSLPRPNDTYQSTRLRSLASGFEGLIRDPMTDHFRNPAYHVCEKTSEVFGDFGSVNDLGKFFFGSFIHNENENENHNGMLGVNVTLDKMLKATTQYTSENSFSGSSSSRTSYTSTSESNPERYGGRLSYSWNNSEKLIFGASYEFINKRDGNLSESDYNVIPASYSSFTETINEWSSDVNVHTASLGSVVTLEEGTLQFFARGIFSTNTLQDLYRRTERSSYSRVNSEQSAPTDVDTKAGLLGIVYETKSETNDITRFLVELAYTSYSATGKQTSLYESGDTIRYTYRSSSNANRAFDGAIWDVKAGIARQRSLTDELKGYAGITINFVANSSDGTETFVQSTTTTPPTSTAATTLNRVLDSSIEGWDIKLPLGLEYALSEHVLLCGGIEPRYRSGEAKEGQISNYSPMNYSTNVYKTQDTRRGLQFSAQAGISFWKEDIGVLSILLGKNVADMTYWSVFMRYFL